MSIYTTFFVGEEENITVDGQILFVTEGQIIYLDRGAGKGGIKPYQVTKPPQLGIRTHRDYPHSAESVSLDVHVRKAPM